MARGILRGLIAGTLVSGVTLSTVSVLTSVPRSRAPVATTLEVPAGSEFDQSRDDTKAALPAGEGTPDAGAVPKVEAPAHDDLSNLAEADTAPAAQPETGQAEDGLATPEAGEASGMVMAQGDDPVLPSPQAAAPEAPNGEGELSISTDPAQPAQPVIEDESSAFPSDTELQDEAATEGTETTETTEGTEGTEEAGATQSGAMSEPTLPPEPETAAQTELPADPQAPVEADKIAGLQLPTDEEAPVPHAPEPGVSIGLTPQVLQEQSADTEPEQGSTIKNLAPDVTTNRLPSIGDAKAAPESEEDATGVEAGAEAEAEAGAEVEPGAEETLPQTPLQRFAVEFENPENRPLMSIILIDDGSSPVGVDALKSFPYPLNFAVDTSWPGATEAMQTYRNAGFEVLAMADLPETASAEDAEVAMQVYMAAVPEAVAVMEGVKSGLQSSREASEQLAPILLDSGYGLVMFPKGLNTVQKLTAREGVPSATVFRDFDAKGQNATVIRRFLDQAAFRAGQEDGGVIMVGRLRADTVSALLLWGLQDRASRVALAPISAVLQANKTP